MKTILALIITVVSLAWGWDVLVVGTPAGAQPWWVVRQEALYLSGLLSIAMLSVAMLLATRPTWLEGPLGGMDRIYRTHKLGWHPGRRLRCHALADRALEQCPEGPDRPCGAGTEGELPRACSKSCAIWQRIWGNGQSTRCWRCWLITLWKRFPYRPWRFLHQAMPALYLMLACHAAFWRRRSTGRSR
jgi:hypothetical protein